MTDAIDRLRAEVRRLQAEKDEWIARFNKLPEIVARAEERGELRARSSVAAKEPQPLGISKGVSMNFGDAIAAMKANQCVQRAGWNGKGMHIYLEDRYSMALPDVKEAGVFRGTTREYEPVICMFTAQGKHQPGWLASQPDILAEDWQVVDG